MHAGGESDGCVLPSKCPNNGEQPPAEGTEGRQPTKENIGQATAPRTQSRISELSVQPALFGLWPAFGSASWNTTCYFAGSWA